MENCIKNYGPLKIVGDGRFSTVYKAKNLSKGEIVAIKVINSLSRVPDHTLSVYREIQSLCIASHPNVVKFFDFSVVNNQYCLFMEYVPYSLTTVLSACRLQESIAKGIMLMFLRGLAHIHEIGILHRDIKPSNLLLTRNGVLKICDFGLCRILPEKLSEGIQGKASDETHNWTLTVGTSWYRAPELLFGERAYNQSVDIWAAGCVMAECLNGEALFPGSTDFEQFTLFSDLLGSPDEVSSPSLVRLPDFGNIRFEHKPAKDLRKEFSNWSDGAIDLFSRMVMYEPTRRISASEALNHDWFYQDPPPMMAPFDGSQFDLFKGVPLF